ncbi:hypothetical protein CRG98_007330 [Punica granatum]|uniref:Uncharacterized protein n=1 Tax=Punica granatum TaxID=22663 RepID=A0A2I0KWM3_PUNGR|nr:hypothetical protein CRG98_007330 [Punica granatum]
MAITRSGRVYQGLELTDKGKAPVVTSSTTSEVAPLRPKKVTDQEAKDFMKVIKASEYKVVEQMSKSSAHISLLSLLLSSEPHRNALLKVLTAAQVPKDTASDRIEETVNSIFSNQFSFADDELPDPRDTQCFQPLAWETMDSRRQRCSFIAALETEVLRRR